MAALSRKNHPSVLRSGHNSARARDEMGYVDLGRNMHACRRIAGKRRSGAEAEFMSKRESFHGTTTNEATL